MNFGGTQPQFGGAIPAHMDDNQKIVIKNQKNIREANQGQQGKVQELEKIHKSDVTMFTDKLAATIGPSYVSAFFVGGVMGLT